MSLDLNNLKTFYNAFIQKFKNYRGNWAQNDQTADDYIKNRPFYEETKVINEPLNIIWDGNTEGLLCVANCMYKISDLILTDEQIKSIRFTDTTGASDLIGNSWDDMNAQGFISENSVNFYYYIAFVRNYGLNVGGTIFPKPGIYVYSDGNNYIMSLTSSESIERLETTIHKLDKKFIDMPENLVVKDDLSTVAYSGDYWDLDNTPNDALNLSRITIPANFSGSSAVSCYGNGIYVALHQGRLNNEAIYSTDGINWVKANELPLSAHWKSICYDGNRFIAVGNNGSNSINQAIYSTDGINWNTLQLPYSGNWQSICYGNGTYVALLNDRNKRAAVSSTDGINWFTSDFPTTTQVTSVCYGDGKFVVVTDGTTMVGASSNKCYYSTTGQEWQTTTLPISRSWTSVCYGNGIYVAVGIGTGHQNAIYSTDGINWHEATCPSSMSGLSSVQYGNGKFIATGNSRGYVFYSTDGNTWNSVQAVEIKEGDRLNIAGGLCYDGSKFILFDSNEYVYYSKDGINWSNKHIFQLDQNVTSETAAILKPYLNIKQPDFSQNDETAPDYIKNRPFYEETEVVNEPLNITWDGNTEGLVSIVVGTQNRYYKVSDAILTDEQIKTITETWSNGNIEKIEDCWDEMVEYGDVTEDYVTRGAVYVRNAGVEIFDCTFPETGIYFNWEPDYHIVSATTTEPIEHAKTTIKKLDKKYLPDNSNEIVFTYFMESNRGIICNKSYSEACASMLCEGTARLVVCDGVVYRHYQLDEFGTEDGCAYISFVKYSGTENNHLKIEFIYYPDGSIVITYDSNTEN